MISIKALDANDWYAVIADDNTLYHDPDAKRLAEAFQAIGVNALYRIDISRSVHPPNRPITLRFPANADAMYEDGVGYSEHFFVLSQVITCERVCALFLSNWDDYQIYCGPRSFVEQATGAALPENDDRVFRIGSAFYAKEVVGYYRLLDKLDVDHPDF